MCRLFGAVSLGPVYYELFEEFADLAVRGNTPRGGPEDVVAATRTTVETARREYGGYSALNFLLTDGEHLYAFRDYEKDSDYYTLYYDDFGEAVLVCSQTILGMRDDPVVKGFLVSVGPDLKIRRTKVL